ncbi:hypothetical protein [Methyloglobulus sp.]|uniref:hypothetical protein n=1 Tax=Methyloglobulus sp. TaxID=2518622 RepID=UPI0032B71868
MENLQLLDEKITYCVKKLIAINSISYCYIELPIDQHCALFGRNNLGKTALLNSLKLHLFPEISFNDCKAKFAFKSSKGELYSTEDSYKHYFPTDNSFLILEAENLHGSFCLILFKSNSSFGYERLILPCAYDEIRKHFWDIDNLKINNGLGSPVKDLGLPKIYALYEDYKAKSAVVLKSKKEIREKLFTHKPLDKNKGRYCLVPLKEAGVERELEAFRQLMNFTFEIAKTDTKGLTETFATIIESGKINAQDRFHQDIQKILDDYKQLRDAQNKLTAIKNYHDNYQGLTQTQQLRADKLINYVTDYQSAAVNLDRIFNEQKQNLNLLETKYNKFKTDSEQLELSGSQLRNERSRLEGNLEEINKAIDKLNQKKQSYERIVKKYDHHDNDEIKSRLIAEKIALEETLDSLKDKEQAKEALTHKVNLQSSKIKERDKKKQAIEQQEKLLINKTDSHTATVLGNLSNSFSTFIANPNEDQLTTINQFGNLFKFTPDSLEFLGETFISNNLKTPEDLKVQLEQDLKDLNAAIEKLDKEIQEYKQIAISTNEQLDTKLNKTEKELEKIKADLVVVNAIEDTNNEWHGKQMDRDGIEQKIKQLSLKIDETRDQHTDAQDKKHQANDQLKELRPQLDKTDGLKQQLEKLHFEGMPTSGTLTLTEKHINTADIALLEAEKQSLDRLKEALASQINEFIKSGIFNLPIDMAYSSYNSEQENLIIQSLRNTYEALSTQGDTLQSQIIEHNKMTGTKITELTSNRDNISNFINKINKQFEGYQISNLNEIRVEIELDPRFEDLVEELKNTNLHSQDIHDDALYQRLNQFCEEFFADNRGNRILEISKIIKNVKYSYKKEGLDKREAKDQSTGTNALINCTLLTILLRDLLAQETRMTLPIVFDEFPSLDEYNQSTAIKAASEHGFALFCASPTVTAEVVSVVDYYITLDDFHSSTIYDKNGERDIVFHHFGERIYPVPIGS